MADFACQAPVADMPVAGGQAKPRKPLPNGRPKRQDVRISSTAPGNYTHNDTDFVVRTPLAPRKVRPTPAVAVAASRSGGRRPSAPPWPPPSARLPTTPSQPGPRRRGPSGSGKPLSAGCYTATRGPPPARVASGGSGQGGCRGPGRKRPTSSSPALTAPPRSSPGASPVSRVRCRLAPGARRCMTIVLRRTPRGRARVQGGWPLGLGVVWYFLPSLGLVLWVRVGFGFIDKVWS